MTVSATKVPLDPGEIAALVSAAFGSAARVTSARTADGGMYNAGYHLDLSGGGPARAFLKAAPPDAMPCLTHERGLMRAEIETLRRVATAGVGAAPAVLFADTGRRIVDRDVVFLEHLPGTLLSETEIPPAEAPSLRRQVGALVAGVQGVEGPAFGYPHIAALQAPTWRAAFSLMLDAVFADAERLGVDPPLSPYRTRFEARLVLLEAVTRPSLVHYDLWDGNILVARGEGGWRVTGLIDWERAFHGDPLAELANMSFHTPGMALDPDVIAGWASVAPLEIDTDARRRVALYRAYLWLIMLIEAGPRGFLETQPPEKWPRIRARLEADLEAAEGSSSPRG